MPLRNISAKLKRPTARMALLNTIAFGVYIFAQQIILLPALVSNLGASLSAAVFIFVAIFSIMTNTLGNELGITQQLVTKGRISRSDIDSFRLPLIATNAMVFVVVFAAMLLTELDGAGAGLLALAATLANTRLYLIGRLRALNKFNKILAQSVAYLVGVVVGLWIFYGTSLVWIPFVFAELAALIAVVMSIRKAVLSDTAPRSTKTSRVLTTFRSMSVMALVNNLIAYADRVLILPIIGVAAMNTYFAGSAMSKMVGLLVNPLNTVFFTGLFAKDIDNHTAAIKKYLRIGVGLSVCVTLITIPTTYLAAKLLYPQFSEGILMILPALAVSCGFDTATSVLRIVMLKFEEASRVSRLYLVFFWLFVIFCIVGGALAGLVGFAYAAAGAKVLLFGMLVYGLARKAGQPL